jgi:hypothetical protein
LTPRVSTLAFLRSFISDAFILDNMDWLGLVISSSSSSFFAPSSDLADFLSAVAADRAEFLVAALARAAVECCCSKPLLMAAVVLVLWWLLLVSSEELSQNELCDRNWDGSWM